MTQGDLQRLFPAAVCVEVASSADEDETLLFPAELALMGGMVPSRRREFAAGRNVARRALGRVGVPAGPLPRHDGGRDVSWPHGSTGSISHTRGLCAAACVRSSELLSVGLDVEQAGPLGPDLVAAICRPEELERLSGQPAPLPSDWPRLVFAMKEAAYKALYPVTRHMLAFHDMRIDVSVDSCTYGAEVLERPVPGLQIVGKFSWDDAHVAASGLLVPLPGS